MLVESLYHVLLFFQKLVEMIKSRFEHLCLVKLVYEIDSLQVTMVFLFKREDSQDLQEADIELFAVLVQLDRRWDFFELSQVVASHQEQLDTV